MMLDSPNLKPETRFPRLDWFYDYPGLSEEERRRRQLFILLTPLGIFGLITFGVVNLFRGNYFGGWLDIISGLVMAACFFSLHRVQRGLIFYRLNALLLLGVMLFWAIDGGDGGEKILWALGYPLMVLFMLGRREGILWSGSLLIMIVLLFSLDDILPVYQYHNPIKVRFICSFMVIAGLTYSYEYWREKSEEKYLAEQEKLQAETKKLAEASKLAQFANQALVKSEAFLKHAQNIAQLGSWEYDYSTRHMWGSEETGRILGIDGRPAELGVEYLRTITSDFESLQARMAVQLRNGAEVDLEFDARRPSDNQTISLHIRAALSRDHQGRPAKLIGVIQDITARKVHEREKRELRQKLERSQKMEALGLLAGGVAHDLNNVMLGLVSYPDFLLSKMSVDDPLHKPLKSICDAGQKAAAIVEDLLTLARRGVTNTEVLNLNQVVTDYFVSPEFEKLKSFHPQVEFSMQLAHDLLNVQGSPLHLKKMVMNLVSNGAEAITGSGRVMVTTANTYIDGLLKGYNDIQEGEYTLLQVADNGSGIETKDLTHIFEPFYTKKIMGRSGTGLGMAVVWGTVQDHCGYIDVHTQMGQGTRIDVYIPVTRAALTVSQAGRPIQDYMGRGEQILIVDDIDDQRNIARRILAALGYVVHTAESGERAVEFILGHPVDLVLLDMIMDPGIDGLETYERIKKITPTQKAIIVSGYSETERVKTARQLGAGAYVKKPYLMETLGLAVRAELDK